jgi:hypothetical protein
VSSVRTDSKIVKGEQAMNTQTRSNWTSRGIDHTRGIALIEALIALTVMVVGVAAIFGVHGYVVGSSAESRLQTVAMSLAQDKIEEFRNEDFASLADSVAPHESVTIINPSIGRSQQVTLRRCWNFLEAGEVGAPAGLVDGLVQVNVTVVRDGETCAAGDRGLASLSGLLARQDPRVAALNLRNREGLDGEGEIVDVDALPQGTPREPNPTLTPGGFEFVRDGSGSLLAVINPETGKALVPRGGAEGEPTSLAIVNLHGNLIIPGTLERSDVLGLGVGALGNGFCRIHYPHPADLPGEVIFPNELVLDKTLNEDGEPAVANELAVDGDNNTINVWISTGTPESSLLPLPPKVSSVSGAYHYIRYSCVLADNWARALFPVRNGEVLPNGERICVGAPERQTDNTDNADNSAYLPPVFDSDDGTVSPATVSGTPTDELRWFGREYVGYAGVVDDGTGAFIEDADGFLERVPAGLQGSTDGVSSVIGSVCELENTDAKTCWDDPALRGWVPGGHHFFIDIDNANDERYCAESMGLMAQIDLEQIVLGDEVPQTFYRNILFRNPGKVYCTSDKEYTIALFDRLLEGVDPRPTDCLSTTRVSGFMVNTDEKAFFVGGTETEPLPGWADIEMLSNQPFAFTSSDRSFDGSVWSCGFIGGFGEAGGAYQCVFNEFADFGEGTELDLRVRATYKDATALSGWVPAVTNPIKDVPQDIVLKSFELEDNRCWGVTVTTEPYDPIVVTSVGPLAFGDD